MAGYVANPATKFEALRLFVRELRVITVPIDYFLLISIENAYAATAHAPNHVTHE